MVKSTSGLASILLKLSQSVLRPLVPRLNLIGQKFYVSDIDIVIDKGKIMISNLK